MPLKLTLGPNERVIVNGCAIHNTGRTHALRIEGRADVIRGKDVLSPEEANAPVSRVYFMVQTALTCPPSREEVLPRIRSGLSDLALVFGGGNLQHVVEAASLVQQNEFYKALARLRPLLRQERASHVSTEGGHPEGSALEAHQD